MSEPIQALISLGAIILAVFLIIAQLQLFAIRRAAENAVLLLQSLQRGPSQGTPAPAETLFSSATAPQRDINWTAATVAGAAVLVMIALVLFLAFGLPR